MIAKLSHRNKFLLLVILSIIIGYLIFKRKISPTIERVNQIKELNQTSAEEKQLLGKKINSLLLKKAEINKNNNRHKRNNFESFLIKEITNYDNKLNVISVSDIYSFKTNGYNILTLQLTLKNDYKTTLKLIDHLERKINSIKIISVDFFSKKIHYNSPKKNLYATISFQTIQPL